jgi:hypothetical protein
LRRICGILSASFFRICFEAKGSGRAGNECPSGCDTSKIGPAIHGKMEWCDIAELARLHEQEIDRLDESTLNLPGAKELEPTAFRIGWNTK